MKKRQVLSLLFGSAIFFFTVTAIAMVSILVYDKIQTRGLGTVAIVILTVILFFTVLYSLIDTIRRNIMITRPVEKILTATKQIAQGNFSVRIVPTNPYGNGDEFDLIMENVNLLAEELGKSEMLKSDFIANVSHELKTPLSIIQSYASALQNDSLTTEERQEYACLIITAVQRLTGLIQNILRLNKLERNALPVQKQWIRLDEQLAECALAFEEKFEEKNLQLTIEMQELLVYTAPDLLSIVWNNLLSNAVKFTDENGSIGITLTEQNGNALVRIFDTGKGIDSKVGARIFEKFYQADSSHATEGNGLGLALVKRITQILGGEISVESEVGKGSVFSVLLKEEIKRI